MQQSELQRKKKINQNPTQLGPSSLHSQFFIRNAQGQVRSLDGWGSWKHDSHCYSLFCTLPVLSCSLHCVQNTSPYQHRNPWADRLSHEEPGKIVQQKTKKTKNPKKPQQTKQPEIKYKLTPANKAHLKVVTSMLPICIFLLLKNCYQWRLWDCL